MVLGQRSSQVLLEGVVNAAYSRYCKKNGESLKVAEGPEGSDFVDVV